MLRLIRTRPFARNVTYRKREFVPLGRSVKAIESYKLGQHFIHNQLNYRGLILFSIPHERYVYDVETKDYTIHDEEIYMALVDHRDVNAGEGHMVMDIFKDALSNLRNVDGFDLVSARNIQPYDAHIETLGYDDFGQPQLKTSPHSFDFENYWYRKFIYDFDGTPKETGNLHKWKYEYFNYDSLKTYERTHWPEGIKVSISPVFLAYNSKTQIKPKFGWKYHFKIELLTGGYYELLKHTFNWQGHGANQLSIDKGQGMYVGSSFNPGVHSNQKKHVYNIEFTPQTPVFKCTSTKLLDYQTATFIGSLLFADHSGREILVTLPSFNISIDSHRISVESLVQRVSITTPSQLNADDLIDKIVLDETPKHPFGSRSSTSTVVSGVKVTGKNSNNTNDGNNKSNDDNKNDKK